MEIYDNIFTIEQNNELYKTLCYNNSYFYGETDRSDTVPTGLVMDLHNSGLYDLFYNVIINKNKLFSSRKVQRAYVNMFLPNDRPYFHQDGDLHTCLFYVNPSTNIDEGGETQFIVNGEIVSIMAKPSRLVIFDGLQWHRASSFRTMPRITVAIKFFR